MCPCLHSLKFKWHWMQQTHPEEECIWKHNYFTVNIQLLCQPTTTTVQTHPALLQKFSECGTRLYPM